MDQDKREVRILQELYLEDGDLHSDKGRQRQFKWKNAAGDFGNDENVNPGNENDSDPDEGNDEQEEKWRLMRHERETFLREQRAKQNANSPADTSIDIPASPLIKMGPPLRKSVGLTPPIKNTFQQNKLDHIDLKKPLGLVVSKSVTECKFITIFLEKSAILDHSFSVILSHIVSNWLYFLF